MQVTPDKLKAQQLVLFHLGYYKGLIDGIWSNATIEAKKKFEADTTFLPAYPNGGLPFGDRDKLPKGMRYDVKGMIIHSDLTPERTEEIMSAMNARMAQADKERKPQPTPDSSSEYAGDVTVRTTEATAPTNAELPHESQHAAQTTQPQQSNPAGVAGTHNHHKHQNQQRDKHKGNR
jgi:hypothetical protein